MAIISGIVTALAGKLGVSGASPAGATRCALILGAPIGAILGALFAAPVYSPFVGWRRRYGSAVVWSFLLAAGLVLSGIIEQAFIKFGSMVAR